MLLQTVVFELPCLRAAPPAALAGLEADLAFCHPAIAGVAGIDAGAGTLTLTVDPSAGGDVDELEAQVGEVVGLSVSSYRFVPEVAPLWTHAARGRYADPGALAEFTRTFLRPLGPGQWALIGPAARLRAALDAQLRAIAAEVDAEPWHLPSIEVASDLLAVSGYFASHPQHVTFGYHLPPDFPKLRAFADAARAPGFAGVADGHPLRPAGFILEPFVCHNVYRALRDTRVDVGRAITALGCAYRYEGFRFLPLLRQWEFSMREVVLVGDAAYVDGRRLRLLELAQAMVTTLDLDASVAPATDPFFVSEAGSARAFQALQSTKLELSLALSPTRATAAASFNLHGDHFTTPMAITTGSNGTRRPTETACVAFGLERWMAAFVARWGAEPAGWPEL